MAGRILVDDGGRKFDANGNPYSGAKRKAFVAGTATPATLYTTSALSTAHDSPLVANSSGEFPQAWADEALLLDIKDYASNDVTYTTPLRQFLNVSPQGNIAASVAPIIDTFSRNDATSANLVAGSANAGDLLNNSVSGAHDGDSNTGFGFGQFAAATSTYASSAFGLNVLAAVTTGHSNSGFGYQSLIRVTTGEANTAAGVDAGFNITTGKRMVVIGRHAMATTDGSVSFTGERGVAIGETVARAAVDWVDFVAIGCNTMSAAPGAGSTTFVTIGANALAKTSNIRGVAIGFDIMQSTSAGTRTLTDSVIIGNRAAFGILTSGSDAVVGAFALFQNDGDSTASSGNAVLGRSGGEYLDASGCTIVGANAGRHGSKTTRSGLVLIGNGAGDVVGGSSAVANNDFVLANAAGDTNRLMWGNFSTGVINTKGVVNTGGNQIGIATAQTPASAAATGVAGTICWDSGFIYVCTATNTWKRVAIATW